MKLNIPNRVHIATYVPPWMILGGVVILSVVVILLAVQNINREKRYMSQLLSEKAGALIKSFEAGTRTGMMGMMWGGAQVQTLLEETSRQPGILYLAVTDKKGRIVAHSDRDKIGREFMESAALRDLQPGAEARWRSTTSETGRPSFEVYRYFRPILKPGKNGRRRGMGRGMGMMDGRNDWCLQLERSENEHIIFVGLETAPFEAARKGDIRNAVIISSVLLLLGFAGLFSMFLAQSFRSTRRLLRDTSAFASKLVTSLPVGLIATDRDGRIAFFNDAAEKITGLEVDEVRGKAPGEVLPDRLCGLAPALEKGASLLERELECAFSQGKTVPVGVIATQIRNDEGEFVGNVLILRDLAEVRRLQGEIRRTEKLAALGGLAAGVAHEIRNPLSSIKGLASYFGSKFSEGSEDKEVAGVMVREVDRLNRVISELLEFARPSELKPAPTDLNGLLDHSLMLVQQDAVTRNITIDLRKDEKVPRVSIDPDRMTQCLLNLYLNAIQAMKEGGRLSIRSLLDGDGNASLEIEDTGEGIRPEDLNRIFDPYFTTKDSGTGLGLAIVHKILEAHDAGITVRSTPGKGTVFAISFKSDAGKGDEGGRHDAG
ncbi:MAG: PAS domain-containing protein [Deltaproteobacteria bacterium]|nr:PAS domain-containing protein [Deltaproteobacteria bacterium]